MPLTKGVQEHTPHPSRYRATPSPARGEGKKDGPPAPFRWLGIAEPQIYGSNEARLFGKPRLIILDAARPLVKRL
jgi:hypothetical protein